MQRIPLAAIPNQSFSVNLGSRAYNFTIKTTVNVMSVDITRDNIILELGARIVAGTPLLPYRYQEDGNFVITTANEEYPFYTFFGVTQFLIYASAAELAAIRGS
jgi:hypothetical protein